MSVTVMADREQIRVDVTPGAHSWLDALATISFKLGCGCNVRMGALKDADEAHLHKRVGCAYPCKHHGEQVITRATQRLTGWREPAKGRFRPTT